METKPDLKLIKKPNEFIIKNNLRLGVMKPAVANDFKGVCKGADKIVAAGYELEDILLPAMVGVIGSILFQQGWVPKFPEESPE